MNRILLPLIAVSATVLAACGTARSANSLSAAPPRLAAPTILPPINTPATATQPALRGCSPRSVAPADDATFLFTAALVDASQHPDPGIIGPSGAAQGRLYLGPGAYGFGPITMPSNVRLEIAPGATLHPIHGPAASSSKDWGLFTFGTETTAASNITITAGDGCGGTGMPEPANKPSNTGFRGNTLTGGMANMSIPLAGWNTDAMWVLDIDPGHAQVNVQVTGFLFHWAYDIDIQHVFSIQNAARAATGIGPVAGQTSRTTAMMFDPLEGMAYQPDREQARLPHRITVTDHYNILAPSGQGANQIRSCMDCHFERIFSHGGDALRVETDGIRTTSGDCSATGPHGVGWNTYAIVDQLDAHDIVGAYGNRTVQLTPHCLDNGVVRIDGVSGYSQGEVVVAVDREGGSASGGFAVGSYVRNVTGCAGQTAQDPHPDADSYLIIPSLAGASDTSPGVVFSGTWSWPTVGSAGGLADGAFATSAAVVQHPASCSLPG